MERLMTVMARPRAGEKVDLMELQRFSAWRPGEM